MTANPFDLEKAIAAWRAFQVERRTILPDDLNELESHLREHTRRLVSEGKEEKVAFDEALQSIGNFDDVEYEKVYWSKLKHRRQLGTELAWRMSMFSNYFKVALRALKKQKGYAFINIFGLAAGLACFILIALFVQHEFSYDRFYENADRIYRVVQRMPGAGYKGSEYVAMMPPPLAGTLTRDFPEVETSTNIEDFRALLSYEEAHFHELGLWTDEHYFDVFSLPLVQGRSKTALAAPYSIVVTTALAHKIFPNESPLGKQIVLEAAVPFTVTGVIESPPLNTSFQYAFLASFSSREEYTTSIAENLWNSNYLYTFFRMAESADPENLQEKLPYIVDTYMYAGRDDVPREEREELFIQALAGVHLYSDFNHDIGTMTGKLRQGNIAYLYIFMAIAVIILLLACVNYINLAIARSIRRSAEVGLRKAVGAGRRQVLWQFLGESMLIVGLALLLALILAHATLPFFSDLVERPLEIGYLKSFRLIPGLILLTLIVGLLSGCYPAIFMAAQQPTGIFQNRSHGRSSRMWIQQTLTVIQFTASIALIASVIVIYQQLQFFQNSDPGFDREHVVAIHLQMNNDALAGNYDTLREEWLRNPRITAVTASSYLPTSIDGQQNIRDWAGSTEDDRLPIFISDVDDSFLEVFGLEMVAGRNFSPEIDSDRENARLINEAAARALGWTPEEAVGQRFSHRRQPDREVIGVLKDFHLHSMHLAIQPVMLSFSDRYIRYISVKVRPENLSETIEYLRAGVQEVSPFPFEYQFLDEQFDQLYRAEQRLGQTFVFFTILALLIAVLGLFGLAAFATEQRTKEIGVRKVLGASAGGLVVMLTKDFTRLVLLSAVLATPIAYLAMKHWLESFAYHVDLGAGVFVLTGVLALLIAGLTVSYQAIKAAMANPVKTIRYE